MPSGYLRFASKQNDDFISNFPGYEVNLIGQVRNKFTKKLLDIEVIGGIPCVHTRWKTSRFVRCREQGFIPLAEMMAVNYKPNNLPIHILTRCEALPKDGNEFNVHPSNLVWKFPKDGIEISYLEGFYYIPGYTQYAINRKGVVIHLPTLQVKKQFEQMGAHVVSAVRDGTQTQPAISVYRLLALTFLDYPLNVEVLVVNHKDGNRMNSDIANLEWITQNENIRHGRMRKLLGFVPPRFTYINDEYDEVKTNELLKSNQSLIPPSINVASGNTGKTNVVSGIKRLDIRTLEVVNFATRHEAIEQSGIIDNQLYQSLAAAAKVGSAGIVKSRFIFRYENEDFPEITREVIENHLKFGGGPRIVIVKDNGNGIMTEYESAAALVRETGLSKKVVTSRLAKGEQCIPHTALRVQYKDSLSDWVI